MRRLLIAAVVGSAILAPPASAQTAGYAIPPDNPFVGVPGARGEIYVRGLRNPFRWSFDRLTGDMLIGDVGGGAREEIDWLPRAQTAGANLGWNCREGKIAGPGGCTVAGAVEPLYDYGRPASGGSAVTGGQVVRDPALPSFTGRYLFGDFFAGRFANEIQVMTLGPGAAPINAGETVESLVAFGEDAGGGLYAVSLNGPVYRLSESEAQLEKTSIGTFAQPMAVAEVPGSPGSLFVVERAGVLRLRVGMTVHEFLDISSLVSTSGERGLLAAAAAPDYAASGRVFVFYADLGGDLRIDEVRRSAVDPTRADPATRRNVLTVEHSSADTHNGGQMLFGPDGYLYLSIGDGGSQGDPEGDAQSLATLLGKVIRIDVNGEPDPPDPPDPPGPPPPPPTPHRPIRRTHPIHPIRRRSLGRDRPTRPAGLGRAAPAVPRIPRWTRPLRRSRAGSPSGSASCACAESSPTSAARRPAGWRRVAG